MGEGKEDEGGGRDGDEREGGGGGRDGDGREGGGGMVGSKEHVMGTECTTQSIECRCLLQ